MLGIHHEYPLGMSGVLSGYVCGTLGCFQGMLKIFHGYLVDVLSASVIPSRNAGGKSGAPYRYVGIISGVP